MRVDKHFPLNLQGSHLPVPKRFYQHKTKSEPLLFSEMRRDVICQVYLLQQTPRKSDPITPDQCPADFPWAYNEVRAVSTKSSLRFYLQRDEKLQKQRNICVNGSDLKIWDYVFFYLKILCAREKTAVLLPLQWLGKTCSHLGQVKLQREPTVM